MSKTITQLYGISPEEFKAEILEGVGEQLQEFSKNFQPKEPTIWITRQEAADLIGVSLVTIHNWTKEGVIHAHKIESDLEDLTSRTSFLIQTKELQNNRQVHFEAQFFNARMLDPRE